MIRIQFIAYFEINWIELFLIQLICFFNVTVLTLSSEKCIEERKRDLQEEKLSPENKQEELPHIELPETVSRLTNEYGSEVYLVGTAHFSLESQEDVSKVG